MASSYSCSVATIRRTAQETPTHRGTSNGIIGMSSAISEHPSILGSTHPEPSILLKGTTTGSFVRVGAAATVKQQQQQQSSISAAQIPFSEQTIMIHSSKQSISSRLSTMHSLQTMTLLQMNSNPNLPSQKTIQGSMLNSPLNSFIIPSNAAAVSAASPPQTIKSINQFGYSQQEDEDQIIIDHQNFEETPMNSNNTTGKKGKSKYNPIPLQTKLNMHALSSHGGDSQHVAQDESIQLASSFLLESGHIRERNYHSISQKQPFSHARTIKFLRDLQEPRESSSSMNEQDEEDCYYSQQENNNCDDDVEEEDSDDDDYDCENTQQQQQQQQSKQQRAHELTKSLEEITPVTATTTTTGKRSLLTVMKGKSADEIALLQKEQTLNFPRTHLSQNQTKQEISNRIKTPSNQITTTTASNRKCSQESTTIEGRAARVSTSETLLSLNSKYHPKVSISNRTTAASLKVTLPSEEVESIRRKRLSSSSSAMIVPDEPEKSILNLPWCISARGSGSMSSSSTSSSSSNSSSKIIEPCVKSPLDLINCESDSEENDNMKQNAKENFLDSIEITKQSQEKVPLQVIARNTEQYFTPALVRCFDEHQTDKQSRLYRQYFQKMFMNYLSPPQLPQAQNQQHQILKNLQINLPPLSDPKKKTIFFDLDETLIHCIEIFQVPNVKENSTSPPPVTVRFRNFAHQSPFTKENYDPCNETLCDIKHPTGKFKCSVSIRPHALEVLTELAKDFELILLTASQKEYADAVLEKLDPNRVLFSHRFYRECCTDIRTSKQKGYVKDLRIFKNRNLANIMLVDNSPICFTQQIENGIPIVDYCNDNKLDRELVDLAIFLKEVILPAQDVRIPLAAKFRLNDYSSFSEIEDLQTHLKQQLV